jgi:Transglutaminase-like superfamily
MGLLSKFLSLPAADRGLLVKGMLWVWMVRIVLWLLPFRLVRQLLAGLADEFGGSQTRGPIFLDRVVWAVMVASRYTPAATCLTQALATKVLLSRNGYHAVVRIGVARSEAGEFQAHAWVESNGSVVIGGSESSLKRYTPLATADGELW